MRRVVKADNRRDNYADANLVEAGKYNNKNGIRKGNKSLSCWQTIMRSSKCGIISIIILTLTMLNLSYNPSNDSLSLSEKMEMFILTNDESINSISRNSSVKPLMREIHEKDPIIANNTLDLIHTKTEVVKDLKYQRRGNTSLLTCIANHEFCRPDDIGMFLEHKLTTILHPPLQVVPSSRRIAASMANDNDYILKRRGTGPSNGTGTVLAEYNPTLLPLYYNKIDGSGLSSHLDDRLMDWITGRYHDEISNEEADEVKYIKVERSTNHHSCTSGLRKTTTRLESNAL